MSTFGLTSFITSLDQIGTDLKVGASITEDKEYFFIIGKDGDGEYNVISYIYSCALGQSVGDLIGATEPIPGVPSSEDVLKEIRGTYDQVASVFEEAGKNGSKVQFINTIELMSWELFEYKVVGMHAKKNLLALPLIVELINGALKDGANYSFKKSGKILASYPKYQKSIATFIEDVMLYPKNENPEVELTRKSLNRIPSLTYSGVTSLIRFPDSYPETKFYEAFIPDTFDDLISFLLNRYIFNFHFYCCANCRRYFAFRTDTTTKNCSRVIESAHYLKDIGRTCKDVGRLRAHVRGLYSNETQVLYQRNYKATFARKTKGKISEEHFLKWGEKAREMRDKCLAGEISYDELEKWFYDNYLRE